MNGLRRCAALVVVTLLTGAPLGAAPPNVLFIAVDDLRPELGCYGSAAAQSPSIDRFAESAVLFKRHYVQCATCGASRYALLTGRSPLHSGVDRGNNDFSQGAAALLSEQQPGAQTMPELFRRSGYRTVCIGKVSHTADGRVFAYNGSGDGRPELPGAWDELATPFGPWKRGWGIFFAYSGGLHREDGGGHQDLMQFTVEHDEDLPDGLLATAAVQKLAEFAEGEQPFFLGLGLFKPHLPFVAPRQDWEAIDAAAVSPPPAGRTPSRSWHASGEFYRYDAPYQKTNPLQDQDARTARRAYLACVHYSDRQVGRVLDALERHGLADDTIVVIWGDHGWHLGEGEIWGKHTPLERATRSTLLVRAPGVSRPGLRSEAPVETIDLYPTLVDLCEPDFIETHHPLDGASLRGVLSGEQEQVRDHAISYWGPEVSIRDARHRLLVRRGAMVAPELYDAEDDPDALHDLAEERPEAVARLQQALYRRHPELQP